MIEQLFVRIVAGVRRLDVAEGQAMTEYALIIALIIAVSVGIFTVFGSELTSAYNDIASKI